MEKKIAEIAELAKKEDVLLKEFKFTCFVDKTLTYELCENGKFYNLNIIADDDFHFIELFNNLLNSKRIGYISFVVGNENGEVIERVE
jgi:hypothetical protein